jgi:dihydropteroate synthase
MSAAQPASSNVPSPAFEWGTQTWVMGILNLSPDSFSGDGIDQQTDEAVARACAIEAAGADILDIGGQSTRPGHQPISAEEERDRVLPALEAIREAVSIPISIDTSRAMVAEAALQRGASIVNDVRGLTADPELIDVVRENGCYVVIMHDIQIVEQSRMISQIVRELSNRIDRAIDHGIAWDRIIIDPGFGFGKQTMMNLELLYRLKELQVFGLPILSGTSRKGTIGAVLNVDPDERMEGTAATVAVAIANGADIVRVHDVPEMVRVARMTDAIVRGSWSRRFSE